MSYKLTLLRWLDVSGSKDRQQDKNSKQSGHVVALTFTALL